MTDPKRAGQPWAPSGADADLSVILNGVYACTRVWEAWDYGTMTRDDFEAPADPGVYGDLIAWRDAAVAVERARWAALREHVTGVIANFERLPAVPGDDATTVARACHVGACRSVLARMGELDSAPPSPAQTEGEG